MEKVNNRFGKVKNYFSANSTKLLGVFGVLVFALLAIYSLCLATPVASYVINYNTKDIVSQTVNEMNNKVLIISIVGLLLSAAYFLLRNIKRKRYYISNFVGTGIIAAYSLFSSISLFIDVANYSKVFHDIDFEAVNQLLTIFGAPLISESTPIFAFGYLLAILIAINFVLLCVLFGIKLSKSIKANDEEKAEEEETELKVMEN